MKQTLFVLLFCFSFPSYAFEELRNILKQKEAPSGVVIEITSSNPLYLKKIIAELKADIEALRERFKDLPVAIVSHARESLILTAKNSKKHPELHNEIKTLSNSAGVNVHVCGTYASWFQIAEEDFPDYINVSPAGPVQVDDYIELGYIHVDI